MPTSNLGEGLRIRNEGARKKGRHRTAARCYEGDRKNSSNAKKRLRHPRMERRPDPRNCPRWLRGSTRTETDREDPLIEMDGENSRPPQKMEGQPATGTRDRVPTLVDPRHDRRKGAPPCPGMANCDYMKWTQCLDGVYISKRTRCHHLVVTAPLGDMAIEEESSTPPLQKKTRPKTGGDLEQTHRIETTVKGRSDTGHQDQYLLASKNECTLSERELSWGINLSRDATAEKAFEDGCKRPVPQATTSDRGPPVKAEVGENHHRHEGNDT